MGKGAGAATRLPVACVLFDIDSTLVESQTFGHDATNEVLISSGYAAISLTEYDEGCALTTPQRLAWHAVRDPDDVELGAVLGVAFDKLYISRVTPITPPLFADIIFVLEALRAAQPRLLFGLVTNASGAYGRAILAAHASTSLRGFSIALGCDDVTAPKPSGDGLLAAADLLGVLPSACVYVGDAVTDGQAAAAAGMRGIGVSWGRGRGGAKNKSPPTGTCEPAMAMAEAAALDTEWCTHFSAVANDSGELLALILP